MTLKRISFAAVLIVFFTLTCVFAQRGGGFGNPGRPGGSIILPPDAPASREDPNLVLFNVAVNGPRNVSLPRLAQNQFRIWEDKVEQKIAYFSNQSLPLSVGIILDVSDGMMTNDAILNVRDAGAAFLKAYSTNDEYVLIQVSDFPVVTINYTTDVQKMPHLFPANGGLALHDSVYLGLEMMKEAANPRKALLVITALGDTRSNLRTWEVVQFAAKQDVQIYSIIMVNDWGTNPQPPLDANFLQELATVSGGRVLMARSESSFEVEALCAEVARELKSEYLIGYNPTNSVRDGSRRGLKVTVNTPAGGPKLNVHARAGYYALKEKGAKKAGN